jgi:hypothetical protein
VRHGARVMVEKDEEEWLREAYPGLTIDDAGVHGTLTFRANYDAARGEGAFCVLPEGYPDRLGGETLACTFAIRISPRTVRASSALPALKIDGMGACSNRHIGGDGSACLMGPFEEAEFLIPKFEFVPFFKRAILPFLYGQEFYNLHEEWPWEEYSHRSDGVFESYLGLDVPTRAETAKCVEHLTWDVLGWPRLRALLSQKGKLTGLERCWCGKNKEIRKCHPTAFPGLVKLRSDTEDANVKLPEAQSSGLNRRQRRLAKRRDR